MPSRGEGLIISSGWGVALGRYPALDDHECFNFWIPPLLCFLSLLLMPADYDDSWWFYMYICRFCMILFRITHTHRHSHRYASASMYMNAYRHILHTHTHTHTYSYTYTYANADTCVYWYTYTCMYILYHVREHVQLNIRISYFDSDCNPPPTQWEYLHPLMVVGGGGDTSRYLWYLMMILFSICIYIYIST